MISENLTEYQKDIILNDSLEALNRGIKINPSFYLSVAQDIDGNLKGLVCLIGAVCIAGRNEVPRENTHQVVADRLDLVNWSVSWQLMVEFSTWNEIEKGIGPERVKTIKDRIKELKL